MKAIVYNKKHVPLGLQIKEIEKPVPEPNEILLKVVAVSINAADYRSMKMGLTPKKGIYGSAVSGTIESIGNNVKQLKPGDEVVGDLADYGFGGLAEYVAAPEKAFAYKPLNTSFEDSVALPVAATTALKALRNKGNIKPGQSVLIVGSSGGVGVFALELAKYFGAKVTAISSTSNIEQSTALGADRVIDYTKEEFTQGDARYDLIVAVNGNYPLLDYYRMLASKGTFVMVGGTLSQILKSILFGWMLSFGGKKMKTLSAKADSKDLAYVAQLMDKGTLKAVIHKRYNFNKAGEAMEYLSQGHSPGKVIITV